MIKWLINLFRRIDPIRLEDCILFGVTKKHMPTNRELKGVAIIDAEMYQSLLMDADRFEEAAEVQPLIDSQKADTFLQDQGV